MRTSSETIFVFMILEGIIQFSNIEQIIISAGASMDDLTKITAFLVNSDDYPDYAKVRLELFPDGGPASSTVFISGLVRPEFLIEIEAFAVIGD